ncbi:MAG: sigma 54-interacting transcriptional regulator [Thermodesulfobacteriota bacterium]
MRAEDLSVAELLKIDPKKGFPLFGSHRIMVTGISSLRRFGDDLTQGLGLVGMGRLLSRLGYENGLTAATVIGDLYDFDSPWERFLASRAFLAAAGVAEQEILDWNYDEAQNRVQFSGIWQDSFEAENYLMQQHEKSPIPICNLLSGLLSGYASGVFGREVSVRETSCRAQGDAICAFEGRTLNENDLEMKDFRGNLTLMTVNEDISRLKEDLRKSREDLARREAEIEGLKKEARLKGEFPGIVFRGKSMGNLMALAEKIAPTTATVLVQGESGTGKELIARLIHDRSPRRDQPFVAVNCAALPPNLLESELFGHVKGAFTGADEDKRGLLLEADTGTFFLDEVSEMPVTLQAKLLRVLQQKEIRPVGGTRNLPIGTRLVAATNRDLKFMIEKGEFREDLYYRLAVFPLSIEPLRRRKEDILILARHFLSRLKPKHPGFAPEVVRCIESYSWPGNIRELENAIEYASVIAGDEKILPSHLPPAIVEGARDPLKTLFSELPPLKELENRYIELILKRTQGNKAEASRILGIGAPTLWRRLLVK